MAAGLTASDGGVASSSQQQPGGGGGLGGWPAEEDGAAAVAVAAGDYAELAEAASSGALAPPSGLAASCDALQGALDAVSAHLQPRPSPSSARPPQ